MLFTGSTSACVMTMLVYIFYFRWLCCKYFSTKIMLLFSWPNDMPRSNIRLDFWHSPFSFGMSMLQLAIAGGDRVALRFKHGAGGFDSVRSNNSTRIMPHQARRKALERALCQPGESCVPGKMYVCAPGERCLCVGGAKNYLGLLVLDLEGDCVLIRQRDIF